MEAEVNAIDTISVLSYSFEKLTRDSLKGSIVQCSAGGTPSGTVTRNHRRILLPKESQCSAHFGSDVAVLVDDVFPTTDRKVFIASGNWIERGNFLFTLTDEDSRHGRATRAPGRDHSSPRIRFSADSPPV
jgi:hypothetical protein